MLKIVKLTLIIIEPIIMLQQYRISVIAFCSRPQIGLISFFLLCFLSGSTVFSQETVVKYLSGTDKDHTKNWDFMVSSGAKSGQWTTIEVPSNWETQGFGTYHYGWEEDFSKNEIGYYKYRFPSNPTWKNKTMKIVFEGSMTDTEVKINGKIAGAIHQGSFYRFKYDITKLLKKTGDNLLEVKVSKISADTSVNRAERMSDFWVFGGIFRPVYLEITPQTHIEWTAIDARADGNFVMDVYTEGKLAHGYVEAQISDLDGKLVGEAFQAKLDHKSGKVTLNNKVTKPALWSPEFPNRYQVVVRLRDYKGKIIHSKVEKFGFRTAELRRGEGFFVNGVKVRFKGVNRHSAWPTSGRTMSKEISELDVNLIKDMNMNAVRMSHYSPDAHFLDICDSLGLFVIDELTGWQKKYDTSVGRKLLKEMVMKDVNHPSIVIWANGNEGGNNHELVADYAKYDPQKRTVIHPWNNFEGTDTQHYRAYDCCVGSLYNGKEVFFPTEFLHGLYDGGHGAGLEDHWNLMRSKPLSAGGFLWSFADEGVVRLDQEGRMDIKGNLAPDGILGPYREKEGSFYTIKEIWSPIKIALDKLPQNFDGLLPLSNDYLYTNLNQIRFSYECRQLPTPYESDTTVKILEKGDLQGPNVEPQQNGYLRLPFQHDLAKTDVLALTAKDPYGREIFTWTWSLKSPIEMNERWLSTKISWPISVDEANNTLRLQSNKTTIAFDTKSGLLQSVISNGTVIPLTNGPQLAVGKASYVGMKHYKKGDSLYVDVQYTGAWKKVRYILAPNGLLTLEYAYNVYNSNPHNEYPFLGINFNFPENLITGVRYMGRGPYRVWKNRMKGNSFGVWNKKYNNTVTGESWDYPEFKGYYRDFNWVVIKNKAKDFIVYNGSDKLFLRLYTPEKPKGARNENNSPDFPDGDISFLHAINAIGTKFDRAVDHGPQGQLNRVGFNAIEGKLIFDFDPKLQ